MIDWASIVTAAAVGSIASSAITLIGQHLERIARRRELLLTKAIELARIKNDRTVQVTIASRSQAKIDDEVYLARAFFEELEHLFRAGKLPVNAEKYYEQEVKQIRERDNKES